jgi:hypothetical protein
LNYSYAVRHRQNIASALIGHKLSEETKQKVSKKAKERDMSGHKNPNFGKTHSKEVRERISKVKKERNRLKKSDQK